MENQKKAGRAILPSEKKKYFKTKILTRDKNIINHKE